ncbi:MAG: DUF1573 domain-containing protein [Saprospiraceae bacterium]|nr:DUF1573 domain-containing protein [Saprospiraceae bacterium]
MKNILFIVTLLFVTTLTFAQPLNRSTYAFKISQAEEQVEKKEYYQALKLYEEAYDESKDKSLSITIADLHMLVRDYRDAERAYARALRRDKNDLLVESRYDYGRALKMMGKHDEAIEEFDKFIFSTTDPIKKELAEMEKAGAEYAKIAKTVQDLTVVNAGKKVNNKKSEYTPHLSPDGTKLYYSAFPTEEITEVDENSEDWQTKIFVSEKGKDGFGEGTALDERVNRPGVFNSNSRLSTDGKRMLFTEQTLDGNVLATSKLYMSSNVSGGWSARKEATGGLAEVFVKSPCFGELYGNQVVFFAANIEGEGEGGLDIFYATSKGDGEFGDPVNLGPKINTPGNEDTPYYRDGMLYFSSTGHPGLGGYDIFQTAWNGARWSEPANMGEGYNSGADDLSLMLDEEGYTGVFTSNRIYQGARSLHGKTCCTDIYFFTLKKIEASVLVTTFDEKTGEPLNGVTVEIIQIEEESTNSLDSKSNSKGNSFDYPLELDVAYMLIGKAENYENDTTTFNTVGLLDSKIYQEKLLLKPLPIYLELVREEPFELENIFYDFDDDKILTPAEPDLQWIHDLMTEYPKIEIELSSHTDARGNDNYNENLSQRRAESARRWLLSKEDGAITRRRIVAKGYGESKPKTITAKMAARYPFLKEGDVMTEEFIEGLATEEEKEAAHQINRRTEFRITAGPTSIKIKEERLIQIGNKKVEESIKSKDDKGAMPKQTQTSNPIEIHKWSSLYGKKNLKGLPIMKFEKRMVELGEVKKGDKRELTYTFKNMGDTPLEIDLVSACECTTLDYSTSTVKPGETGTIKAVFDSSEKEESETIDIDIYLKNVEPDTDMPVMELLRYSFNLKK